MPYYRYVAYSSNSKAEDLGSMEFRDDVEARAFGNQVIRDLIGTQTTRIPHSTQDAALHQAEKLLREHGCDLDITLHLDEISEPPSIWFNKNRMQRWCLAGFPAVRI